MATTSDLTALNSVVSFTHILKGTVVFLRDSVERRSGAVDPDGHSNPTNGPITMSSAVINATQTALMTSPAGSMSNIR